MQYYYHTFKLASSEEDGESDLSMVFDTGDLTLLCRLYYEKDDASILKGSWICTLDLVSDEIDIPERSFVLHPGTVHFDGDPYYIVGVASELETIGATDLENVYLNIGVPVNE